MNPEVVYLRDRCRLIVDALRRAEPDSVFLAQIGPIVEGIAAKGDVRGLRTLRRDLLEMSQVLSPDVRAALQASLDVQEADDPIHHAG